MCIIVAKNAGIKMPTKEILSNCFNANPDGAGIMLACGGLVHGFKGLMTFEAFAAKLSELEAHYGSLDKLPVIMHFRIGTHGSNIQANTHPFPLSDDYRDLRKLAWTAKQGMAHNGIISACSSHPDVHKENVSDTMVFVKRLVAPISKSLYITDNADVLEGLQIAAGSKLAFMSGDGNIAIAGDFVHEDGIFYSNTSYTGFRKKASTFKWDDYYDGGFSFSDGYDFKLSRAEEEALKIEIADDIGLEILHEDTMIESEGAIIYADGEMAIDPCTGIVYLWDDYDFSWYAAYEPDEYTIIDVTEVE